MPRRTGHEQPLAASRPTAVARRRFLVLEPGAHAGLRDGFRDRSGRQLCRVVLDPESLPHHVGVERLEAREPFQPALEDRHFLVAVHALDLERRLGVQLADSDRCSSPRNPSILRRECERLL